MADRIEKIVHTWYYNNVIDEIKIVKREKDYVLHWLISIDDVNILVHDQAA